MFYTVLILIVYLQLLLKMVKVQFLDTQMEVYLLTTWKVKLLKKQWYIIVSRKLSNYLFLLFLKKKNIKLIIIFIVMLQNGENKLLLQVMILKYLFMIPMVIFYKDLIIPMMKKLENSLQLDLILLGILLYQVISIDFTHIIIVLKEDNGKKSEYNILKIIIQ